jgi:hypothetical protein
MTNYDVIVIGSGAGSGGGGSIVRCMVALAETTRSRPS